MSRLSSSGRHQALIVRLSVEQPIAVFLQIPEASQMPYLSYNVSGTAQRRVANMLSLPMQHPVSLRIVEERLRRGTFASSQLFDLEMSRLFEKARRSFTTATQQYGHVLEIQVRAPSRASATSG